MQPEDRENWFWKLSEIGTRVPRDEAVVSDEILESYRAGRLSEDEAREVERQLIADPANRRRLIELAGLAPPAAPEHIRRRLLSSTAGERTVRPRRWLAGLAAAAAVVIAVGSGVLLWPPSDPAPPEYTVEIAAFRGKRGLGESTLVAEARAGTPVEIAAAVAEEAVGGVEVALYLADGAELSRIDDDVRVERRPRQGAVSFKAPASVLVGFEPGDYAIFVVIAWKDQLPDSGIAAGPDPAATLASGGRRVHRLTLRLLPEDPAAPSVDGG